MINNYSLDSQLNPHKARIEGAGSLLLSALIRQKQSIENSADSSQREPFLTGLHAQQERS